MVLQQTQYLTVRTMWQPPRDGPPGTVPSQTPSSSSCPFLYNLLRRPATGTLGLKRRFLFSHQVSNPGWPQILNSPVSASPVLGLRECATKCFKHFKTEVIQFDNFMHVTTHLDHLRPNTPFNSHNSLQYDPFPQKDFELRFGGLGDP